MSACGCQLVHVVLSEQKWFDCPAAGVASIGTRTAVQESTLLYMYDSAHGSYSLALGRTVEPAGIVVVTLGTRRRR